MTPEAQRIAIAEACGWRDMEVSRITKKLQGTLGVEGWLLVPNYLNDLNAMHEAEKVLTTAQSLQYVDDLAEVVNTGAGFGSYGEMWEMAHATAAQRAEAFLRTLGKWTDTP